MCFTGDVSGSRRGGGFASSREKIASAISCLNESTPTSLGFDRASRRSRSVGSSRKCRIVGGRASRGVVEGARTVGAVGAGDDVVQSHVRAVDGERAAVVKAVRGSRGGVRLMKMGEPTSRLYRLCRNSLKTPVQLTTPARTLGRGEVRGRAFASDAHRVAQRPRAKKKTSLHAHCQPAARARARPECRCFSSRRTYEHEHPSNTRESSSPGAAARLFVVASNSRDIHLRRMVSVPSRRFTSSRSACPVRNRAFESCAACMPTSRLLWRLVSWRLPGGGERTHLRGRRRRCETNPPDPSEMPPSPAYPSGCPSPAYQSPHPSRHTHPRQPSSIPIPVAPIPGHPGTPIPVAPIPAHHSHDLLLHLHRHLRALLLLRRGRETPTGRGGSTGRRRGRADPPPRQDPQ